jgi:hypothetical protein
VRGVMEHYILWAIYIEMNKVTLFLDLYNIRFFICFEAYLLHLPILNAFPEKKVVETS